MKKDIVGSTNENNFKKEKNTNEKKGKKVKQTKKKKVRE